MYSIVLIAVVSAVAYENIVAGWMDTRIQLSVIGDCDTRSEPVQSGRKRETHCGVETTGWKLLWDHEMNE